MDVPHKVLAADPETPRGFGGVELFFLRTVNECHSCPRSA